MQMHSSCGDLCVCICETRDHGSLTRSPFWLMGERPAARKKKGKKKRRKRGRSSSSSTTTTTTTTTTSNNKKERAVGPSRASALFAAAVQRPFLLNGKPGQSHPYRPCARKNFQPVHPFPSARRAAAAQVTQAAPSTGSGVCLVQLVRIGLPCPSRPGLGRPLSHASDEIPFQIFSVWKPLHSGASACEETKSSDSVIDGLKRARLGSAFFSFSPLLLPGLELRWRRGAVDLALVLRATARSP